MDLVRRGDQWLHDTCGAEGNLSVTVTENGMLESSNNEEIKHGQRR